MLVPALPTHGVLLGLDDQTDHTWALYEDGTNPLTGNWAVGGFNITGIGTLQATRLNVDFLAGFSDDDEINPYAASSVTLGANNSFLNIRTDQVTTPLIASGGTIQIAPTGAGSPIDFLVVGGVPKIGTPGASMLDLLIQPDGDLRLQPVGGDIDAGSSTFTTTALGEFGELTVDNININGNTIKNSVQDQDLIFEIDDGGTPKTITWDADVDQLKHSAGTFDFDDDDIVTDGDMGIGTSTLPEKLNILGDEAKIAIIDSTDTSRFVKIGVIRPGAFSFPGIWFNQATPSATNYSFMFDGSSTLFSTPNNHINFRIQNTQRMQLNNSGNFLIGTTTDGGELLQVAGTVRIDGDTYWVGAGTGLPYGSFWGNDIAFVTAGGTGSYTEISDADITVGQTNLTTFQNNKEIAVTKAGVYKVIWSMSGKGTGANKHIVGGIGVDAGGAGALTIQNDGRNHAVTTGNAEMPLAGCALLDLSASSEVGLMVTNETDNTNVTIEHVNLVIEMSGGT